jgi:hypothetical protein
MRMDGITHGMEFARALERCLRNLHAELYGRDDADRQVDQVAKALREVRAYQRELRDERTREDLRRLSSSVVCMTQTGRVTLNRAA